MSLKDDERKRREIRLTSFLDGIDELIESYKGSLPPEDVSAGLIKIGVDIILSHSKTRKVANKAILEFIKLAVKMYDMGEKE